VLISREHRSGLRIRCEKGVDIEVREAILKFAIWLREQIRFPIRVPVYVKKTERIKNMYGEIVVATFFAPYDKTVEPYARISTGDYNELNERNGKYEALGAILHSMAHELAHYEQWVKDRPLSERTTTRRARQLLDRYTQTNEI
jgi:hypothetical protein